MTELENRNRYRHLLEIILQEIKEINKDLEPGNPAPYWVKEMNGFRQHTYNQLLNVREIEKK